MKIIIYLIFFQFLEVKFPIYLNRRVFVMQLNIKQAHYTAYLFCFVFLFCFFFGGGVCVCVWGGGGGGGGGVGFGF